MKSLVALALVTIAAGCAANVYGPNDGQKVETAPTPRSAAPPSPMKETAAQLAERYKGLQKRYNGAYLSIKAREDVSDIGQPTVVVEWSIDYTGPRPPLTILRPGLIKPTSGQTRL